MSCVSGKKNQTFLCFLVSVSIFLPTYVTLSTPAPVIAAPLHTPSDKVVALTFDADMTPYMLKRLQHKEVSSWYNSAVIEALEEAQVPATLFLTGMWIETYATTTRLLSENPLLELGNHSYTHGGFTHNCYGLANVPEANDLAEILKTDALLQKYATRYVKLFRFPGLCHDAEDLSIVSKAGYTVVDGDIHGDDGFQKNPEIITEHVLREVRPGSIIVLHMHGGPNAPQTAAALPSIIKTLREKGYTFVKVSDLLGQGSKNER